MQNKTRSSSCIIDGIAISYSDVGSGEVLVFVHGWLDKKETFNNLIQFLSSEFRCISLDLPNFGKSENSNKIVQVEDYAKFVGTFLKKLKILEYVYIGHSMGGQIGIYATAHNILRPRKLVLIASAGIRSNQTIIKYGLRQLSKILKNVTPIKVKDKLYKSVGSDYSHSLSPVHKKIISSVLSEDILQVCANISTPTILIYGSDDKHTPPWMGRKLHQNIKNSNFILLNNQNHWLHSNDAPMVAKKIKDFLK